MHVLLLNEYYPPDTSATANMAAHVAETLSGRHHVTVIAGRPSYDPDERYPFRLLRREVHDGVTVERVGSTAFPRRRMTRRLANYLSYLALAVPRALALRGDLILSMTDPPVLGIAAAKVARLARRPFVYNIRDLYPDMALGGEIVRAGGWVERWERLHRQALRQAARVIVLGEDMRERVMAKGVRAERIVIIRDGTALPERVPPPDHPIAKELRCGFPFVLVHAGNLGFSGAWETLVRAAKALEGDGVGLVFVGDGANRRQVESAAAGSSGVRFLPFRPVEQVPYVMAAGDVHVVTVRRGLEGVVVPSKLYSTLAAGRPVLAVAPEKSDVARIVEEERCGLAADPDSPASVAEAICRLRNDPALLATMGRRAREAAKKYARVNELKRFLGVIEEAHQDNWRRDHLEP